jgi:hypothetical protein
MAEPRRPVRFLPAALLLALALAAGSAHAEVLQGLEMDVMEPGESAVQATSRIVLPRPRGGIERSAEYPGLDTEQRIGIGAPSGRLDGVLGESLNTSDSPAGPTTDPVTPPSDPVDPGTDPGAPGAVTGGPGG